jgi:cystathionine beta-lyase family protein involved in aluminum resistance
MSNIYSDNIHKNFVDPKKAVALPRYIGYDPKTRATIIIDSIDMAKKIFKDVEGVVLLEVGGVYGNLAKFLESVGMTENGLVQP